MNMHSALSTPSYVPLHHCTRLKGMTPTLMMKSYCVPPVTLQSLMASLRSFFFWESAPCPMSRCIMEQKLSPDSAFQFKRPSAWWENGVCLVTEDQVTHLISLFSVESSRCQSKMMGYLQTDPENCVSVTLVFLSILSLSLCFEQILCPLCLFFLSLLHFKGMWIMKNTQILSHTFEVWIWRGLFTFSAHDWTRFL